MLKLNRGMGWLLLCASLTPVAVGAQLSPDDYRRAQGLREKYSGLVSHMPDAPYWIEGTEKFVFRRTAGSGHEFVLVDAATRSSQPAFDAARLATVLSQQMGHSIVPDKLPFVQMELDSTLQKLQFDANQEHWRCDLAAYSCTHTALPQPAEDDGGYDPTPPAVNGETHKKTSPDGHWAAWVESFNVMLAPAGQAGAEAQKKAIRLTEDGSEGNYYALDTLVWSPDSKHLVLYRIRPGYRRLVHYIESSPQDQLQPKHSTMVYPKPGDVLPLYRPVLIDIAAHHAVEVDNTLFSNPYELSELVWRKDSRAFTFEYNQRGHQLLRVLEVDAASGRPRVLIEESAATFVNYPPLSRNQFDHGAHFRQDLADGRQIVWASERDGWEHLYLYDGKTAQPIRQITQGNWVVRAVDRVDEKTGVIYFEASGMNPEEDPYYVHGYRIGLDGSGLKALTPAPADHTLSYSPDGRYFVDLWSRVDQAPVMELRNAADGNLLMEVDRADDRALRAAGWRAPEPFHAPGRDGKTEIWGVIHRPANFDATRKYPVIENIYAGPQGAFVPKSFTLRSEALTELGFVVVQIDGMGTNNRSRAFHDVAWRNLKDGGFADRILWHKAVAARYPWYDIARVGIFGTSAGGQNALAALLFHPEFYKAGVANCGSHDNRMDKIWWNEQWMGWPVGSWYGENSNVDNAWRLQGSLLLVVGEMDKNVDPATTLQVADRLIKAGKDFDLLFVPGGGHGAGGKYGERKLMDFFVRHLTENQAPEWNRMADASGQAH